MGSGSPVNNFVSVGQDNFIPSLGGENAIMAIGSSVAQDDMLMVTEGVNTTEAVHRHAARLGVDMPIAAGMHQILFEGADIKDVIASLMQRASMYETSDALIQDAAAAPPSITEHAAMLEARARRAGG